MGYPQEPPAGNSETDIAKHGHIKPKPSTWLSSTGCTRGCGVWFVILVNSAFKDTKLLLGEIEMQA